MKRFPAPLVIREVQIKVIMKYYYTLTGIAKIQNTVPSIGEDVEELELSYTASGNEK